MPRIDIKNTTFRFEDGGSNQLNIKVGDGTVTYSEKKPREFLLERGSIDTVRDGDQVPMDLSFQLAWEFLTGAPADTVPTPEDALKQVGDASAWVSSNPDACQPYCIDVVAIRDPICATEVTEQYTFQQFYYEDLAHDFKAGTISCTGRCNSFEADVVRGDQYT
jgi:hypothetical protein